MANGEPGRLNGTGYAMVDAAVRIVTQVGFPVVAAGVLLYFVLFRFTSQVEGVAKRLEVNATAVERVTAIQTMQLEELKRQTAALEELVQRVRYKQEPKP